MSIEERIKIRVPDIDGELLKELVLTAKDRILLRLEIKKTLFPTELESIVVEVVTSMYNKHVMKNEGVENESIDAFSIKFINDLLRQYDDELIAYKNMLDDERDENKSKVRFI